MATIWEIIRHVVGSSILAQITVKYPEPKLDLSGRTFVVTSSNTGLGLALAIHLARFGASQLILAVRSLERGNSARDTIIDQVGNGCKVEVWELDNARFESVVAFANRANAELSRLDGLALNAGVSGGQSWAFTDDGWERTVQVNALAPGLLALLMLPLLNRTAQLGSRGLPDGATALKPHITITGSGGQHIAKFPQKSASHILNALNDQAQYVPFDRYPLSKLLDYFLVKKLSSLALAHNVVVNTVDPGLNTSEITRDLKLPAIARLLIKLLAWPASKGALNVLWGLTEYDGTGAFVSRSRTFQTNKWLATDFGVKVQDRVWKEEMEVWKAYAPEVQEIISMQ